MRPTHAGLVALIEETARELYRFAVVDATAYGLAVRDFVGESGIQKGG